MTSGDAHHRRMRRVGVVIGALMMRGLLPREGTAGVQIVVHDGRPYWVADVRPFVDWHPEGNEKPQPDPNHENL